MKIPVVMGSPRKGNTYPACENMRLEMQQYNRYDFEYLWLRDAVLLPLQRVLLLHPERRAHLFQPG